MPTVNYTNDNYELIDNEYIDENEFFDEEDDKN